MSIASGYNPYELYPCVYITDLDEKIQYYYESENVKAGYHQDFTLLPNWQLHVGANDDPGYFEFYIQDNSKALVDARKASKIKRGWNVQLFLGQPSASPTTRRWFYGQVITADIVRSGTGFAIHRIYCAQWGWRKKKRLSKIIAIQKKQSDGTTPDSTDTNAKASEIIKRMVSRKTWGTLNSLPTEQQTLISGLISYHTWEEEIKDQYGQNHGTPKPALKDGTTENKTKGWTAATKTTLTGSVYVVRFSGLDAGDEISHVMLDIITSAGNIRVKVYDEVSSEPTNLLAESGSVASPGTGNQYIALTSRATIPANGIVWVGFESDSNSLVVNNTTGLTSGSTKTVLHTYGTGPNPFGTPTNQTYGINLGLRVVPRIPNNPAFVNGICGLAADFSGAQVVELANESNFDRERTAKWSWSGWCKFDNLNNTETIFAKWQTTTPRGILIQKTSGNKIRVFLSNTASTNEIQVTGSTTLAASTWYHVIVTYDGSSAASGVKIYINSVAETNTNDTNNLNATILNNKVAVYAGRDDGASSYTEYMDGKLDDCRFYNVELTQYQINALYAVPFRTDEVQDIDVKIEGIKGRNNTFEFLVGKLIALTAAFVGLDQDRKLFMRLPNQVDSGFRFTNDRTSTTTTSWNQGKIGFFQEDGALSLSDSIRTGGDSVLVGLGASERTKDIEQNPTLDATFDLSANYVAIKFTPNQNSINSIALKMRKRNNSQVDFTTGIKIRIVDSVGGTGAPDLTNQIISVILPADRLNSLDPKTHDWVEILFQKRQLIPDRVYYVIVDKYGSAASHVELGYSTGGAGAYYTSTDATSWTGPTTGTFALRTYPTTAIQFIMYNAAAARKFGINERVVNLTGIPTLDSAASILFGLSPVAGAERRIYPPIKITPTAYPIPIGCFATLYESFLALTTKAMILSYDIHGKPELGGGANEIEIQLEEYATVA